MLAHRVTIGVTPIRRGSSMSKGARKAALDIISSSKLTISFELRFRKAVSILEQITCACKYLNLSSRQMKAVVYIYRIMEISYVSVAKLHPCIGNILKKNKQNKTKLANVISYDLTPTLTLCGTYL